MCACSRVFVRRGRRWWRLPQDDVPCLIRREPRFGAIQKVLGGRPVAVKVTVCVCVCLCVCLRECAASCVHNTSLQHLLTAAL